MSGPRRVTVRLELAESILTLMERAAAGELVPAAQWHVFAGELTQALVDEARDHDASASSPDEGEPGTRCTAACGYCGRCGGA